MLSFDTDSSALPVRSPMPAMLLLRRQSSNDAAAMLASTHTSIETLVSTSDAKHAMQQQSGSDSHLDRRPPRSQLGCSTASE